VVAGGMNRPAHIPGSANRPGVRKHELDPEATYEFLEGLFGNDLHARRVLSLSNGVLGVQHAAAASIHAIGEGLAAARGLDAKHAIKQIDRLLSNAGIDLTELLPLWVPYVLAERREAVVSMDWTDFDDDDHTTLAINLITRHGRATPLLWRTVWKSELAGKRNGHEDDLVCLLSEILPEGMHVTVLADRGFGDQKLYAFLRDVHLHFIIRFRADVVVERTDGVSKPAREWMPASGRLLTFRNALVTKDRAPIERVVMVRASGMKEAWCLASDRDDLTGAQIKKLYGRRFTTEENFRDTKNLRFGLGLSATRIGNPDRRDRLLLVIAMAQALLTLLGAAAEKIGLDRTLKVNTVKKRTHSLFRQGLFWYSAIPNMREERFQNLMKAFGEIVASHAVFTEIFGAI
jgi:hypothetical protein